MKKTLSLLIITVLLSSFATPLFAQSDADTDSDRQLAELLAEMQGSSAIDNGEQADTMPEEEVEAEAENSGEEEHMAAEAILDMIEGDNWSFAGTQKTEITEIGTTSITINTTAVLYDGTPVQNYIISYSNTTIADLANFEDIMIKEVGVEGTDGEMVTVILDDLMPETRYFFIVSPVHPTDPTADGFSMGSPEVTAITRAETPEITDTTIIFQNASHTQDKNAITLTWTPTELVANGSIEIRHADEATFTKVGTVSMVSGSYTFTVNKSGNYFLKLQGVADNGDMVGAEQIQNIKVEEFEQPEAPVQTAPQVGPTTDLIMMLFILAFIIYFVYRFRRVER